MNRAAEFSAAIAARIGRPAVWYVSTFDGTECRAAFRPSTAVSTSAAPNNSGNRSYG